MMGVAFGASTSPWFVAVKQSAAEWLLDHGMMWPLEMTAPWWIFINYPLKNDALTLLDGTVLIGYILTMAVAMGAALSACLALATLASGRWSWRQFHHLAQTLIPLAGCGVFLGLSGLTVSLLRSEGVPVQWVVWIRIVMLAGAAFWSLLLAWRVAGLSTKGAQRLMVTGCTGMAVALGVAGWGMLF